MKRITFMLLCLPLLLACHKKPDPPAQQAATIGNNPPPPPPPNHCQNDTVVYTMPVQVQNTNTVVGYVIPNFDKSCGDTLQVLIRNTQLPSTAPWTTLLEDPNGSSYYTVTGTVVSVHNNTGDTVYVEIIATLL